MNESYYQGEATGAATQTSANMSSSYQADSNAPVARDGSANTSSYQSGPVSPSTNNTAPTNDSANKQGQSTGAEGDGPDFICRSTLSPIRCSRS